MTRALGVSVLLSVALMLSQTALGKGNPSDQVLPACVHYSAQAVLTAVGYNHVVYIKNACTETAECEITTSANQVSIDVDVPAKKTRAVITYRNSPARIFDVRVKCRLVGN
jgi:hypothetical protein